MSAGSTQLNAALSEPERIRRLAERSLGVTVTGVETLAGGLVVRTR